MRTRPSNVTITDVARKAGVGVGTVSRVLNHGNSVSSDTTQLVRQAMAGLGYRPPPPEKRRGPRIGIPVRSRRTNENTVLIVLGQRGLRWILDYAPVYASVLHGVESALAERGRNLLIRQAGDWQVLEQVIRQCEPDGLVMLGDQPSGAVPGVISRLPSVWMMGSPVELPGDFVQPDHSQCGILAGRWALRQGHRHCAVIGSGGGSPGHVVAYRNDAFRWTVERDGGTVATLYHPQVILSSPEQNSANEPILIELIDRLIALDPRPTALLSQADLLTPSIYRLLLERQIRPQHDMAIISVNNERPYLTSLRPQPVIIDLQAEAIGRRAVDQLFWRMVHRGETPMRIMIEPLLIESQE